MQRLLTLILLLVITTKQAFCVDTKTDSLNKIIAAIPTDKARVDKLVLLANDNLYSKPYITFYLSQRGLYIARRIHYPEGELKCLKNTGDALEQMGNYPSALHTYLEALRTADSLNRKVDVAKALINIGFIYQDQDEYRPAIDNTLKAKALLESIQKNKVEKYDQNMDAILINLGYYYLKLNRLDSALYFEQNAYTLAVATHNTGNMGNILQNLGLIQEKLKNNPLAVTYYRMSIQKARETADSTTVADSYVILAKYYRNISHTDSSVIFAQNALNAAKASTYIKGILDASSFLASVYEHNDKALAYDYYKVAMSARDSLFDREKVKEIQNLKFEEKAREQELLELKIQQDEDRKSNLQLAAIALFIPVFFLVCLLLSNTKVHHRVIEISSVLSLLFLFEFITLLIHPLVEKFTNHTPIVEFVIFVCVASFMAPTHHHLTGWLKDRLLKRHHNHTHNGTTTVTPERT